MIKRQSLSPAAAKRIEEGREAVREGGGGGGGNDPSSGFCSGDYYWHSFHNALNNLPRKEAAWTCS